ncbi:MAG TPA: hypothetical protein VGQ37_02260 [Vicinamibacterales bacterium]|jgi:hypothetical protein|nr:hypothetical protein [Vicinamibacterales bacterium]
MTSYLRKSSLVAVLIALSLAHAGAGQQATAKGPAGWVLPRTADGRPDLEGVWENNSATPLERPAQLAQKPRLSDEELAALEGRARTLLGPNAEAVFGDALYLTLLADTRPGGLGATGSYSQNWLPDRYFEHRTSLITDPADGRLPPATPAGTRARASFRFGEVADSAQGMTLQDRCIHYGFPDLFAGYMSVYRITQSPQYVAIQMEKIHDARIIPLDGHAHLSPAIRQYLGDSRGRWEGDTLLVETTNFHPKGNPMGGYSVLSDENLQLTERFRRTADDTIEYSFTIDDPTMWTRKWSATINWKRSRGEQLEYACHEGNYSLRGMLSAARSEEAGRR